MSEHQALLLTLQLGILLVLARLGGELACRLGQPAVIGQLLAGLVLGKSLLGTWWPQARAWLFPAGTGQAHLLEVVTWLGVLLLLFLVGLETDLVLIRQQGRPALCTAAAGFLLPFALGFGVAQTVPDSLLSTAERPQFALFIAVALSESSVPVVSRILADMRLLRRNVGQTILATALLQDTVGWILLAGIAAAAATGGHMDAAHLSRPVLGILVFSAFALTLGRRWAHLFLRWVNDRLHGEQALLAAVLVLVLAGAAGMQALGVHSILGAFLVGVMIAGSPVLNEKVIHPLEALTGGFLAPIFFAAAGVNVDLSGLARPEMAVPAALLLLAACAGKILGGFAGGRLGGLPFWEALSVGMGINARGALGIVIAVLGLRLNVLSVPVFSALILTALVTTAMTPPLLRWTLRRVKARPEEQARLDQETVEGGSFLGRVRRVLLPTSGGADAVLTARLLRELGEDRPVEVTVLHVATPRHPDPVLALEPVTAALRGGKVTVVPRTAAAGQTAVGIRRESEHGYDLVALSCGEAAESLEAVFGRAVEQVAVDVRSPLLLVRGPRSGARDWPPRQILVPTTGLLNSTQAAELGVAWARPTGARVTALHVVEAGAEMAIWLARQEHETEQLAREVASWVVALAEPLGIRVDALVRSAPDAAPEIIRIARESEADLIVLSGMLRPTHRLFMGHTVDYVLRHAPCAVAVLRV